MRHSLGATLSAPVNGWMTFELQTPDGGCSILVSYTPNDFLGELLTALILAASGVEGVAKANSEPNVFAINFAPKHDCDEITLRVVEFPNWKQQSKDGQDRFVHLGNTEAIVLPLWRAVRRIESVVSAEDYRKGMRREFPADKLAHLSGLLGKS